MENSYWTKAEMLENWEVTEHYMDEDICRELDWMVPCTKEEYLDEYLKLHEDKYGETLKIN